MPWSVNSGATGPRQASGWSRTASITLLPRALADGADGIILPGVEAGGHALATEQLREFLASRTRTRTRARSPAAGGRCDHRRRRRARRAGLRRGCRGGRFAVPADPRVPCAPGVPAARHRQAAGETTRFEVAEDLQRSDSRRGTATLSLPSAGAARGAAHRPRASRPADRTAGVVRCTPGRGWRCAL
jgi:hypothetical protein